MKYLSLFFCLFLFSCDYSSDLSSEIDGDCVPITLYGFLFNSQEGIDSLTYGYWHWKFTGVQKEKECEVEPETIKCSWFSVVKKDSTVFVSVKQNDTDLERHEYVNIKGNGDGGKCSAVRGGFDIIQCPIDVIELSKEELLFSSEGGTDSITVANNRNSWLYLRLDGSGITGGPESGSHEFIPPYTVEGSWFTISIPDRKKVIFSVNKNDTGKERYFIATFGLGICGSSSVTISQSTE